MTFYSFPPPPHTQSTTIQNSTSQTHPTPVNPLHNIKTKFQSQSLTQTKLGKAKPKFTNKNQNATHEVYYSDFYARKIPSHRPLRPKRANNNQARALHKQHQNHRSSQQNHLPKMAFTPPISHTTPSCVLYGGLFAK